MMESSAFPEDPIQDTSDEVAESPETEDVDEDPESQNIPGSSESSAPQDPLLPGGRNHSKKRATLPSKRAGRKSNQSKVATPKPPTSSISLLIYSAVASSHKKSGLSLQALKKMVANMGYDVARKKHYFLRSIRNMVAKGQLWQVKGTGATGSFKINPDFGKKNLPMMKGKGPKNKHSRKNKKRSAMSKNGRETAKKQAKANVKKTYRSSKMSSVQATSSPGQGISQDA